MSYNYASIIPLIGGETIAMENGFNKGCLVSNGEKMLLNQAEKSWMLWNK